MKRKSRQSRKHIPKNNVIVDGVGDLLTTMAKCCKPVPYDAIVGYITRGRGITIHRRDCAMIQKIDEPGKERLINVMWASEEINDSAYPVDIRIFANDRKGLLRDISNVLSNEDVDVVDVKTHSDKKTDQASMRFTIEIENLRQLSRVIEKLSQLPEVIEVKRQVR